MEQLQRETADRCDTLAKIVFVIGLLGSIAAAYFLGNDYSYSSYLGRVYFERNWAMTIGWFLGGLFSTGILYEIMEGISLIIEAQIKIMRALKDSGIVASKKEKVKEENADNSNVEAVEESATKEVNTSEEKVEEGSTK